MSPRERIDGYLSRRAQQLDPTALVVETEAGWVLRRADVEELGLGDHFGAAQQALDALLRSEGARSRRASR